jgi:hypothetical protein
LGKNVLGFLINKLIDLDFPINHVIQEINLESLSLLIIKVEPLTLNVLLDLAVEIQDLQEGEVH